MMIVVTASILPYCRRLESHFESNRKKVIVRSMADALLFSLFRPPIYSTVITSPLNLCEQHDAMMGGRRVASVLGCLLLLLSVVVSRAASGLKSPAVSPSDASSCSRHPQSCDASSSPHLASSEAYILNFLKPHISSNKTFHVQGWRWHTLSLSRDLRRLGNLAFRLMRDHSYNTEDKTLDEAVYHVIDFNMKALHRIENDLFFPWLRTKLTSVDDPSLAESFEVVLDDVIENQRIVSQLGSDVLRQKDIAYGPAATDSERHEAIGRISDMSADLASRVRHILKREDSFLVPAVAILTSVSQQRVFNNKVILSLGIFDSRVHLVGMYEAVLEQGEKERALFQAEIPAISCYMITRWKRLLYDPQAGVLEESQ